MITWIKKWKISKKLFEEIYLSNSVEQEKMNKPVFKLLFSFQPNPTKWISQFMSQIIKKMKEIS